MTDSIVNFLPYQKRWLKDQSRFKIGMFARQSGKTFTTCGEIVDDCIQAEIQRRRVRWVILSRSERQAREAMDEAIKPFTRAFYEIYNSELRGRPAPDFNEYEFRAEESDATYNALEVQFPSGSRITALPANPDTARGFSANVMLDEFALHKDSRKIWAALFPVISKAGLRLRVVSTPKGKGNKFYELMTAKDSVWSRHTVDIYQAVEQGLDRNIDELRSALNDEEVWAQEYELKWLDEASAWLSYDLITSCEDPKAGIPELYEGGPVFIGNDIARRRDLWVAWVFEEVGDVLWTREIIARRNITFAEQDAIIDELMLRYRATRLAMDQTGMGEKPVEDAKRRHGGLRVEGVQLTSGRRLDLATAAKQRFEDRRIRIPAGDPILRSDLHQLKKVVGPTGNPRLVADSDGDGHADRAWAGFLGIGAAEGGAQLIEFSSTGESRFGLSAFQDEDGERAGENFERGYGVFEGGFNWRGY
jgi:phage FluMu gp28-like protein